MSSPALQEKVLDFINCSGAVMEKAAQMQSEKDARDTAIAELIPQAVQALLENERIEPHQKEAAERILRDPVQALKVLIKTAHHRNDAERATLGKPVAPAGQQKRASVNSTNGAYVGAKVPEGDKESTRALKAKLGLPVD
jgi:hypothetical protein